MAQTAPPQHAAPEHTERAARSKSPGGAAPLHQEGATGAPLPVVMRRQMEESFGASFKDVRVSVDASAESRGARAMTQGNRITVAPREWSPGSASTSRLIAHELAHVQQQRAGKVGGRGGAVNADGRLEAEAHAAADRVVAGQDAEVEGGNASVQAAAAPVQLWFGQRKVANRRVAPAQAIHSDESSIMGDIPTGGEVTHLAGHNMVGVQGSNHTKTNSTSEQTNTATTRFDQIGGAADAASAAGGLVSSVSALSGERRQYKLALDETIRRKAAAGGAGVPSSNAADDYNAAKTAAGGSKFDRWRGKHGMGPNANLKALKTARNAERKTVESEYAADQGRDTNPLYQSSTSASGALSIGLHSKAEEYSKQKGETAKDAFQSVGAFSKMSAVQATAAAGGGAALSEVGKGMAMGAGGLGLAGDLMSQYRDVQNGKVTKKRAALRFGASASAGINQGLTQFGGAAGSVAQDLAPGFDVAANIMGAIDKGTDMVSKGRDAHQLSGEAVRDGSQRVEKEALGGDAQHAYAAAKKNTNFLQRMTGIGKKGAAFKSAKQARDAEVGEKLGAMKEVSKLAAGGNVEAQKKLNDDGAHGLSRDARDLNKLRKSARGRLIGKSVSSGVEAAGSVLDAAGTFTGGADAGITKATGKGLKLGVKLANLAASAGTKMNNIHNVVNYQQEMEGKNKGGLSRLKQGAGMFFGVKDLGKEQERIADDIAKRGGKTDPSSSDKLTERQQRKWMKSTQNFGDFANYELGRIGAHKGKDVVDAPAGVEGDDKAKFLEAQALRANQRDRIQNSALKVSDITRRTWDLRDSDRDRNTAVDSVQNAAGVTAVGAAASAASGKWDTERTAADTRHAAAVAASPGRAVAQLAAQRDRELAPPAPGATATGGAPQAVVAGTRNATNANLIGREKNYAVGKTAATSSFTAKETAAVTSAAQNSAPSRAKLARGAKPFSPAQALMADSGASMQAAERQRAVDHVAAQRAQETPEHGSATNAPADKGASHYPVGKTAANKDAMKSTHQSELADHEARIAAERQRAVAHLAAQRTREESTGHAAAPVVANGITGKAEAAPPSPTDPDKKWKETYDRGTTATGANTMKSTHNSALADHKARIAAERTKVEEERTRAMAHLGTQRDRELGSVPGVTNTGGAPQVAAGDTRNAINAALEPGEKNYAVGKTAAPASFTAEETTAAVTAAHKSKMVHANAARGAKPFSPAQALMATSGASMQAAERQRAVAHVAAQRDREAAPLVGPSLYPVGKTAANKDAMKSTHQTELEGHEARIAAERAHLLAQAPAAQAHVDAQRAREKGVAQRTQLKGVGRAVALPRNPVVEARRLQQKAAHAAETAEETAKRKQQLGAIGQGAMPLPPPGPPPLKKALGVKALSLP